MTPQLNSQAFSRKVMSNLVTIAWKRRHFVLNWQNTSFMGLIFSRRVTSGAKLLFVSSLICSKYSCFVSIFLVTYLFALTARTSSRNHLNVLKTLLHTASAFCLQQYKLRPVPCCVTKLNRLKYYRKAGGKNNNNVTKKLHFKLPYFPLWLQISCPIHISHQ